MQILRIELISFMVPLLAMLYGCQPGEARDGKAPAVAATAAQHAAPGHADGSDPLRADATKLAKDIGCFACHSIDKKFLGPSWKSVAALYRLDPAGEGKLKTKIAQGGSGVWGDIAMPAYPDMDEEKRRVLVKFILSLE